jgi:hypothetical protein
VTIAGSLKHTLFTRNTTRPITDSQNTMRNFRLEPWLSYCRDGGYVTFKAPDVDEKGKKSDESGLGIAVSYKTGEAELWRSYIECLEVHDKKDFFVVQILPTRKGEELLFGAPTLDIAKTIAATYEAYVCRYYDLVEYVPITHAVPPTAKQVSDRAQRDYTYNQ